MTERTWTADENVPGEKCADGECRVESGVGIRLGRFVDLTSAPETRQRIEQTWAHEADNGEHDDLSHWLIVEALEASVGRERVMVILVVAAIIAFLDVRHC